MTLLFFTCAREADVIAHVASVGTQFHPPETFDYCGPLFKGHSTATHRPFHDQMSPSDPHSAEVLAQSCYIHGKREGAGSASNKLQYMGNCIIA